MKLGEQWFTAYDECVPEDERGDQVHIEPASGNAVQEVLSASEDDDDGRSEWLWIRLPNGGLILGVYPQGDTYFATEADHS